MSWMRKIFSKKMLFFIGWVILLLLWLAISFYIIGVLADPSQHMAFAWTGSL